MSIRKSRKFPFLKVKTINYQRNGISGAGFYAIHFDWNEPDQVCENMIATVFDEDSYCGVVCMDDPTMSWRGDYFEDGLRNAIKNYENRIWKKLK